MKELIIKTQKEFDEIKSDFSGKIIIKDTKESLSINHSFDNAYISVDGNATIKSVYGNATIKYVDGNATIKYVDGNATIEYVSGNATIKYVSGNATIKYVYGNATIKYVYGNATIEYVDGNATIKYVYGNATIKYVYGNATILLLTGLACICFLYNAKKIVAKGLNMIRQIGVEKIDIEMSKSVNYIQVKETIAETPTIELYSKLYPIEKRGTKLILYKSVHKNNKEYYSDYDINFKYEIGKIITENIDKNNDNSCSKGIHISNKNWAILFGENWDNQALLECEVNAKDVIVSKDCDGKVRASKIKVLREVPREEWYD